MGDISGLNSTSLYKKGIASYGNMGFVGRIINQDDDSMAFSFLSSDGIHLRKIACLYKKKWKRKYFLGKQTKTQVKEQRDYV